MTPSLKTKEGPCVCSWKKEMTTVNASSQGDAYGQAGEDKAIEDHIFLHQVFCRLLYHTLLHF